LSRAGNEARRLHGKQKNCTSSASNLFLFKENQRLSKTNMPVPSAMAKETKHVTLADWQHPGLGLKNSLAPGEALASREFIRENKKDEVYGL
jgi:hypothetical protein